MPSNATWRTGSRHWRISTGIGQAFSGSPSRVAQHHLPARPGPPPGVGSYPRSRKRWETCCPACCVRPSVLVPALVGGDRKEDAHEWSLD